MDTSNVIIDLVAASDVGDILSLLETVNALHADLRPDLFVQGNSTKYSKDELIEHMNLPEVNIFVARVDDKVVGYCFTELHSISGNNIIDREELYIDDLCVDESCRGLGIAKKLYAHVKSFAKDNNCYCINLNVWEGNDGARHFYESVGMFVRKTMMEEIL